MKAKFLKDEIKNLPDNFEINFNCDDSIDWEVSVSKSADSKNGLTDFTINLSKPINDKDVVYIY